MLNEIEMNMNALNQAQQSKDSDFVLRCFRQCAESYPSVISYTNWAFYDYYENCEHSAHAFLIGFRLYRIQQRLHKALRHSKHNCTYALLAKIEAKKHKYEQALQYISKAYDILQIDEYLFCKASYLFRVKQYQAAANVFLRLFETTDSITSYAAYGVCMAHLGIDKQAIQCAIYLRKLALTGDDDVDAVAVLLIYCLLNMPEDVIAAYSDITNMSRESKELSLYKFWALGVTGKNIDADAFLLYLSKETEESFDESVVPHMIKGYKEAYYNAYQKHYFPRTYFPIEPFINYYIYPTSS